MPVKPAAPTPPLGANSELSPLAGGAGDLAAGPHGRSDSSLLSSARSSLSYSTWSHSGSRRSGPFSLDWPQSARHSDPGPRAVGGEPPSTGGPPAPLQSPTDIVYPERPATAGFQPPQGPQPAAWAVQADQPPAQAHAQRAGNAADPPVEQMSQPLPAAGRKNPRHPAMAAAASDLQRAARQFDEWWRCAQETDAVGRAAELRRLAQTSPRGEAVRSMGCQAALQALKTRAKIRAWQGGQASIVPDEARALQAQAALQLDLFAAVVDAGFFAGELPPKHQRHRLNCIALRDEEALLHLLLGDQRETGDASLLAATLLMCCEQRFVAGERLCLQAGADAETRQADGPSMGGEAAGPTGLHLLCAQQHEAGAAAAGERSEAAAVLLAHGANPWATARTDSVLRWRPPSGKAVSLQPMTASTLAYLNGEPQLAGRLHAAALAWRQQAERQPSYRREVAELAPLIDDVKYIDDVAWTRLPWQIVREGLQQLMQGQLASASLVTAERLARWSQSTSALLARLQQLQLNSGFGQHGPHEQVACLYAAELGGVHERLVRGWSQAQRIGRQQQAKPSAAADEVAAASWHVYHLLNQAIWLIDRIEEALEQVCGTAQAPALLPAVLASGGLHAQSLAKKRTAGLLGPLPLLSCLPGLDSWQPFAQAGLAAQLPPTDLIAALGLSLDAASPQRAAYHRDLVAQIRTAQLAVACSALVLQHRQPQLLPLLLRHLRTLPAAERALWEAAPTLLALAINGPEDGLAQVLAALGGRSGWAADWLLRPEAPVLLAQAARCSGAHLKVLLGALPPSSAPIWRRAPHVAQVPLAAALMVGNVAAAHAAWTWRLQVDMPIVPTFALLTAFADLLRQQGPVLQGWVRAEAFATQLTPLLLAAAAEYGEPQLLHAGMVQSQDAWQRTYLNGQNGLHLLAQAGAAELLGQLCATVGEAALKPLAEQADHGGQRPHQLATHPAMQRRLAELAAAPEPARPSFAFLRHKQATRPHLAREASAAEGERPAALYARQRWAALLPSLKGWLQAATTDEPLRPVLEAAHVRLREEWRHAATFDAGQKSALEQLVSKVCWTLLDALAPQPFVRTSAVESAAGHPEAGGLASLLVAGPEVPRSASRPAMQARYALSDARYLLSTCIEALKKAAAIPANDFGLYSCIGMHSELACCIEANSGRQRNEVHLVPTKEIYFALRRDWHHNNRLSFVTIQAIAAKERKSWDYWQLQPALPELAAP